MYILVHVCIYSCMYELVYVPMVLICDESKVGASSRRWELRVEGKARSRPSSRRSSFESKVRASFKLEVAGGPVESVESKVFGASSRRSTFESKVGASSRRWDLRVEGRTSGLGPVYTTSNPNPAYLTTAVRVLLISAYDSSTL